MIHVSEQNTVCSVTIMNFTRFRFMKLKIELFFFFQSSSRQTKARNTKRRKKKAKYFIQAQRRAKGSY